MLDPRADVLLVDPDPASRKKIRESLGPDFSIVAEAEDGPEGLRLAEELHPELVLLDLDLPELDGIEFTRRLRRLLPGAVVVALSREASLETVRMVLAAGARDFLRRPLQAGEVQAVAREVLTLQRGRRALLADSPSPSSVGSGIWAFTRAIGGVGQTTLLLSLANELVTLRKKVMVVDLHPHFGHLGFYLGLDPGGPDLADLAEFPSELTIGTVGDLARAHASGLKVICSPEDLLRGHGIDPERLVARVLELSRLFDYVLVDMPAGIPDPLLPILDEARFLFLVGNGSLSSLKSSKELFALFRKLEYPDSKLRPVLVSFQGEKPVHDAFARMIEKVTPGALTRLPEDEERVSQAIGLGQPVSRVFPKSPYTRAVRRSLVPLLQVSPEEIGAEEPRGIYSLFDRLFGED